MNQKEQEKPEKKENNSLSTGQIIGIVLGFIAIFFLVIIAFILFSRRNDIYKLNDTFPVIKDEVKNILKNIQITLKHENLLDKMHRVEVDITELKQQLIYNNNKSKKQDLQRNLMFKINKLKKLKDKYKSLPREQKQRLGKKSAEQIINNSDFSYGFFDIDQDTNTDRDTDSEQDSDSDFDE